MVLIPFILKREIFQVTTVTPYQDQSRPNTGIPFSLAEVKKDEISGVLDKR